MFCDNPSVPTVGLEGFHSLPRAHGTGPEETIGFPTFLHGFRATRRHLFFFCPASRKQCREAE